MIILYLMVGAAAGVLSGLFGVGGGVVVIPALAAIFLHNAIIPPTYEMHMAIGTSLAIMITTSLSATYAHHKRRGVRWDLFLRMLPGLAVGSIAGAIIAYFVSSAFLKIFFSVFLFIIGIRMIWNRRIDENQASVSLFTTRAVSAVIGVLASLLGIGGGVFMVPFLLRCQLNMREATGTSVVCSLLVGVTATISLMVVGFMSPIQVAWSTGYIYWPAFLGIGVASTFFAPLGAMLAHTLPTQVLKRVFGVLLFILASDMLFNF